MRWNVYHRCFSGMSSVCSSAYMWFAIDMSVLCQQLIIDVLYRTVSSRKIQSRKFKVRAQVPEASRLSWPPKAQRWVYLSRLTDSNNHTNNNNNNSGSDSDNNNSSNHNTMTTTNNNTTNNNKLNLYNTGVCEQTFLLQERLPCEPSAETAFRPLIVALWKLVFPQVAFSGGVSFSQTPVWLYSPCSHA